MQSAGLVIRPAEEKDAHTVLGFVRELARYEKLIGEVQATEQDIREHLFGPDPAAHVLLAFYDGAPVGFCLYFRNFSTFLGKPGLYLEDLFVTPAHRGTGIGTALLSRLARIAATEGYGRVDWAVLEWNPAQEFYRKIGAVVLDEWRLCRLTGPALKRFAHA